MSATHPVPVVLITASTIHADLRETTIAAIRAMTPDGELLVLTGSTDTLARDLAAANGSVCVAIDLPTIDDVNATLDTLQPLVAEGRLDLLGIVTTLDTAHFWNNFFGGDAEETRELVAQIESASLVVLSHDADVSDETRNRVEGFVRNLNPTTAVIPESALAGQTLASLADAIAAAEDDYAADSDPDDEAIAGETDAWGFNSFTWTTDSLLDRDAFLELFEEWPSEILRAHGVVRMEDGIVILSAIRDLVTLDEYDDLDEDDGNDLGAEESELAFVGIDLPVSELVERLEACQIDHA